jgi:periplasmic protein TonB
MPILRWCPVLLALAAVPAVGQQPAASAPAANATGIQSDAANALDKSMHVGGKVQKPIVVYTAEAEFSQQAREAKYSGIVSVYLWVDKDGKPSHIRVVRGAGMGLDEKAVEAVRQYRFKPATLDGQPVTVDMYVDVSFHYGDGIN